MKQSWFTLIAIAAVLAACGDENSASTPSPAAQSAVAQESHGVGVVQSVDAANGRVTIAHGPIESLGWPAMTMGFNVAQRDVLTNVKEGQRVEFTLRGRDMSAVITSIKPAE